MNYIWSKFRTEVVDYLKKQGIAEDKMVLETPPAGVRGHLAFACHVLAREYKKNPANIAAEIAGNFANTNGGLVGEVVATGPYVNFLVDGRVFLPFLQTELDAGKDMYGSLPAQGQKIGIEFVQPNTNKALSIGHARNASLGWSMSQVLKFAGYEVVRINLFNDRGVHICKSMLAYQKWGNNSTPADEGLKPDHFVGKYYAMFTQKSVADESLEKEAQVMLKKWEEGDNEVLALWKKMTKWFYEGVEETFRRYGIEYDQIYYESDLYQHGKEIIEKALKKGYCYRLADGAIEVDLEAKQLGKKILQRRDGTSVYIVQDLYLAKKKFADLQLDWSIYVVADEQKYHFDVLFELLDKFEIVDREKNYHLAYGMVNLKSGKMSSRRGTVVKMDDLLDELHILAKEQIAIREADLPAMELDKRAEKIAQAAMKYNLLNQDKNRVILFNKEEAIKFEGDTGPYLLYTYARVMSIWQKSGLDAWPAVDWSQFVGSDEYLEIMTQLARFSTVIKKVAEEYNPAILAKYLYTLAQLYNSYYHHRRILDAKDEIDRQSGLVLSLAVAQILRIGLSLMGIEVVEKM
ncbi:MAG: arginine--tRNA ligase [Patescibacteria group bacterium]